jgi:hypothetical protein
MMSIKVVMKTQVKMEENHQVKMKLSRWPETISRGITNSSCRLWLLLVRTSKPTMSKSQGGNLLKLECNG